MVEHLNPLLIHASPWALPTALAFSVHEVVYGPFGVFVFFAPLLLAGALSAVLDPIVVATGRGALGISGVQFG